MSHRQHLQWVSATRTHVPQHNPESLPNASSKLAQLVTASRALSPQAVVAASKIKNVAVSVDHLPPTSSANTTNFALLHGPTSFQVSGFLPATSHRHCCAIPGRAAWSGGSVTVVCCDQCGVNRELSSPKHRETLGDDLQASCVVPSCPRERTATASWGLLVLSLLPGRCCGSLSTDTSTASQKIGARMGLETETHCEAPAALHLETPYRKHQSHHWTGWWRSGLIRTSSACAMHSHPACVDNANWNGMLHS